MRKILSICTSCLIMITLLMGCSKDAEFNKDVVNISILNSKPEIENILNDAIKEFEKENNNINIKLVKYNQSDSYENKLNSMYVSNNAPTMTLVDPSHINNFKDKCIDLSSEEWVKDISGETSEIAKNKDGKLVAFPLSTEGVGFIYNKKVMKEAGINPDEINTISSLEAAFQKVQAIGKSSLVITNEEWSLGDHFISTFYSVDQKNSKNDVSTYFDNLKNEDLKNNKTLNGLIDTFDVMKKYNMYSSSPLTPSYDKCSELLGRGEVGFWYMGNWASQQIISSSSGNEEFGFISVPISNNPSDYGNNEIAVGVTKYIIIDGENSSAEQQEAAKKFLNYLVYNEKGNKFLVEDAGIIPAFDNIEMTSKDPLITEIVKYRDNDNIMELMNSYLPVNNSKIVGGALRKYLNNEISRENLIDTIKEFWC